MRSVCRVSFLALALVAAPSQGRADDPAVAAGTGLLEEGDRLADRGQYTEAVVRYKRAMEQLLPRLRKIPFKHEVKRDVTKREDMKAMILKELDEDMTPAEFRANELAMKVFGLVPRGYNLREALAQVYSEEVAAFYDPKTKTMHLIEETKKDRKKPTGLLERIFGKKDDFDKDENKTVIAHELTHALADQHYNLDAMDKAVKGDDDRALALSALIEGEATLAMFGAGMDDWEGTEIVKMPAETLEWTLNLMSAFMPFLGSGQALKNAPAIISESMIFPYFKGMVFCAKLTNKGGWNAIDDAYQAPPLSTEQILHPEKYRGDPDLPMSIDLGILKPGAGWKEAGRNVLGEMQLGVMLKKHGGKTAAPGWDGDRYAVFEGPMGRLGLVWLSTWDSADDAREFLESYANYQTSKVRGLGKPPKPIPDSVWRNDGDQLYVIQTRGQDVAVVEGFSPEATCTLLDAALQAKKTEIRPIARKDKPAGAKQETVDPKKEPVNPKKEPVNLKKDPAARVAT
jgi:hypothetical protein